ncbi:hypothetical protein EVAR_10865_1 [Eumeta japonica]|uniref:Uncharacterized protein n=1 Tax=Eumeta variegata TaxID=151549 RepID=A0A4C1URV2_EUMVA|nr:hypothetical protein EVAR_10865_1 [Eumeta japonica]
MNTQLIPSFTRRRVSPPVHLDHGRGETQTTELRFGTLSMCEGMDDNTDDICELMQDRGVPKASDMPYGRFLRGSPGHRMSLDTDTGRVRWSYPAQKRPGGVA